MTKLFRVRYALILLLVWAVLKVVGRDVTDGPVAASADFRQVGNEFVTTRAEPGQKAISQRLKLESGQDYVVEFEAASSRRAHIVAGFASGTNVAPNQSFTFDVGENAGPIKVRRILNSGTSPGGLQLKIASDSEGKVLIRKVTVLKRNLFLELCSWLALGLALLIVAVAVLRTLPGLWHAGAAAVPASVPWVWPLITGISVVCLVRNLALPRPFVFGDELIYALLSKFAGREALVSGNPLTPVFPNTLYLHLYKLVFRFDENFLEAAKVLNVFFFAIALFALYGAVKLFRNRNTALAVVAIVGLGPASIYSFCFMPESLYFCLFSLMVYCFVRYIDSKPLLSAALCGICLGANSLVKPHALILIVPWLVTVVLLRLTFYLELSWRRVGGMMLGFIGALAASIVVLNFVLTGEATLGLGSIYGPMAAKSASAGTFGVIAGLMGGHFAAVSALYALPLLVLGTYCLQRRLKDSEKGAGVGAMVLLTTTCLITLIFTTSKFTSLWAPGESELLRLFGRYYFFVLPWVVASFFCAYPELDWSKRRVRVVFTTGGIAIGALALLAILKLGASHIMPFPDFPDIFWFYTQPGWPRFVAAFVIGVTLLAYLVRRPSSTLYAVSLGVLAVTGSVWTSAYVLALPPTGAETASAVFKPMIRPEAFDSGVMIVGSGSDVEAYRMMFHLLGAYDVVVQGGTTPVTELVVGDDRPWAIVAGTREVNFPYSNSVTIGRYTLYLRQEGVSGLYVPSKGNSAPAAGDKCAEQLVPVEQVVPDGGTPFSNIDIFGAERQSVTAGIQTVAAGAPLHVSGWAVEPNQRRLPSGVMLVLDQGKTYPATYNLDRSDVAGFFNSSHLRNCGFSAVIPAEVIAKGAHEVAVRVVSSDHRVYWMGKRIKFKAE